MGVEVMQTLRRQTGAQAGFSLIEVLVAAVILLFIALGMVPLFTRAITSNAEGYENTEVVNYARSRAEEYLQYPFNSPQLTLGVGDDVLEIKDFYSQDQEAWVSPEPADEIVLFNRTTQVRQFGVTSLETPLPGGSPPSQVHLKEITVTIEGRGINDTFGTGKQITVRTLKAQ
jgi:prepilin-type N-terminal cleavage/methylation domain-containing protein